jgi:hypothetical protein
VVRYIDGVPTDGRSEYEGTSHTGGLHITYDVLPQLTLLGGLQFANTLGDFHSYRVVVRVGGEYYITKIVAVGAEVRYYDYEEFRRGFDDYEAWNLDLWMRVRF